jgi:hypothetical protein
MEMERWIVTTAVLQIQTRQRRVFVAAGRQTWIPTGTGPQIVMMAAQVILKKQFPVFAVAV